jgi:hypothetical protein
MESLFPDIKYAIQENCSNTILLNETEFRTWCVYKFAGMILLRDLQRAMRLVWACFNLHQLSCAKDNA